MGLDNRELNWNTRLSAHWLLCPSPSVFLQPGGQEMAEAKKGGQGFSNLKVSGSVLWAVVNSILSNIRPLQVG